MPGTVRWFTFAARREITREAHALDVVLTPLRRPPQEFFPHAFGLSGTGLARLGRPALEDGLGRDLFPAGRSTATPDLADARAPGKARAWVVVKDDAIRPQGRGGRTGEDLHQQLARLRGDPAWRGAEPHLVGLTVREAWEQRRITFHALQPMVLPGGRAAFRLLFDVGQGTRQDRVNRYADLRWKTLFDGLYRHLLEVRPTLQRHKQRYRGRDHRRIRAFKGRGLQLSLKLWPDHDGRLGVLVAWRASGNNPGAKQIVSRRSWTARVLPLGEAQQGLDTALRERRSLPWWEGTPLLEALTTCCDEFVDAVQVR